LIKNKLTFFFFVFCTVIYAQDNLPARRIYTAIKSNPASPIIDGKIDDPIWKNASIEDKFIQFEPMEKAAPSQETDFRICYNDKNLFVLIQAYDTEPQKIVPLMARRDEIDRSDAVGIFLDSYFDRRTAFEFSVNVTGVKFDAVFSDDDRSNLDKNWDPVWDVATSINDSGWIAEMRIPFNQLRFASRREQTWGLEVYRYIHRTQEVSVWQFMSRSASGFVSNFGILNGIHNIPVPRRMELLPYAVSKLETCEPEEGNPFSVGKTRTLSGGLDGKIGLSSDVTADFTINPDFGQVEADPSEVNLTAFETFFQEKRPFFIEGKNIFQYALGIGDGDFARETLFYSRRIGRTPQHEPDLEDVEYIDAPQQTSILGAAKISGKTSRGWSLGILDAVTAEESAQIDSLGTRKKLTVEPFTNYFIGRLQRDFNAGNTSFGGMVTTTNRNINQSYLNYINRSAYTGGIDLNHQWINKSYFTELKLAFSHIRGHQEAILEAQTSSARYFQRPDANYLTLDSSRTSLNGHGGSFNIGKQGNGKLRYVVGGIWRSPGLELNDLGYLQKADQIMQYIWIGYQIVNPSWMFRQFNLNVNQWNGWNFGGEKLATGGNINGGGQFNNYYGFYLGINRENPGITTSYLRGGPAARYEGGWNDWFRFYSDSRNKWQIHLRGNHFFGDDQISHYYRFSLGIFLKPASRFNISFDPFYMFNRENLQYVDTIENDGEDRYLLAKLDQKTFGLVFRLNYSISPELSIQYYGQPFISAGAYSEYKRVTEPRAQNYYDRFHQFTPEEISTDDENQLYLIDEDQDGSTDYVIEYPDFNFKQFRSNLVIRWEYRPGSLLYLVWSQDLTAEDEYGDFSLKRDIRDLFQVTPDNVYLVKLNYWFSL
jgi:hypothetical protein